MAVVLTYWKDTTWRIGKFAHKISSQIRKISTKISAYIFNIKLVDLSFSRQLIIAFSIFLVNSLSK